MVLGVDSLDGGVGVRRVDSARVRGGQSSSFTQLVRNVFHVVLGLVGRVRALVVVCERAVEELVQTLIFQLAVLLLLLYHLVFTFNRLLFELVDLFISVFESSLQIGDLFFCLLRSALLPVTFETHFLEVVTQFDQLVTQVALATIFKRLKQCLSLFCLGSRRV